MKTNSSNAVKAKSFLSSVRSVVCSKSFVMLAVVSCVMVSSTFAQSNSNTITTLDTWGGNILGIFSSNWVKALACVALIVEAIGMIVAGQQGGGGAIIKKFAPWIVGTVILLTASGITSFFLKDLSFDGYKAQILLESATSLV